jgi:hypothetical protein
VAAVAPAPREGKDKPKKIGFGKKSMVGKDAYTEEGGERIGTVAREVLSGDGGIIGYEVIDKESNTSIYLPGEQVKVTKGGLLVQPLWYTEGMKFIRKLELQESFMPELGELTKNLTPEAFYEALSKFDPSITALVDEANKFRASLQTKLSQFESEYGNIREELVKTTSEHLIDRTERKGFTEKMLALRKRAQLLDGSIKKCKELILRLDALPLVLKPSVPSAAALPTAKISCPYAETCPILKKGVIPELGKPTGVAEPIKPFRIIKMAEMKRILELEAKKIEEDMRRRLSAEFGMKTEAVKKVEEVVKEEVKKKRKGLLERLRTEEKK